MKEAMKKSTILQLSVRQACPRSVILTWNLYEEDQEALRQGTLHGYKLKVGTVETSVDLRKLEPERRRLYSFRVQGLEPGTSYLASVAIFGADGFVSSPATVPVTTPVELGPPTINELVGAAASVALDWTSVPEDYASAEMVEIKDHEVRCVALLPNDDCGGEWTLRTGSGLCCFVVPELPGNTRYKLSVRTWYSFKRTNSFLHERSDSRELIAQEFDAMMQHELLQNGRVEGGGEGGGEWCSEYSEWAECRTEGHGVLWRQTALEPLRCVLDAAPEDVAGYCNPLVQGE